MGVVTFCLSFSRHIGFCWNLNKKECDRLVGELMSEKPNERVHLTEQVKQFSPPAMNGYNRRTWDRFIPIDSRVWCDKVLNLYAGTSVLFWLSMYKILPSSCLERTSLEFPDVYWPVELNALSEMIQLPATLLTILQLLVVFSSVFFLFSFPFCFWQLCWLRVKLKEKGHNAAH